MADEDDYKSNLYNFPPSPKHIYPHQQLDRGDAPFQLDRRRSVKFQLAASDLRDSRETDSTSESSREDLTASVNSSKSKNSRSRFKVEQVCEEERRQSDSSSHGRRSSRDDGGRRPSSACPGETYSDTCRTFGRNTLESLPHVDHYRNIFTASGDLRQRPTLVELHEQEFQEELEQILEEEENGRLQGNAFAAGETKPQSTAAKFGWIKGVFVRCLLNIFGVMLFLRLSWVVGQAGIGLASVIILLASVVTTLTSLSMSAICTNGEVKGGGAYYMISRSLGPEFGGAIGIIFSIANAVAAAMYIVGFAETIRDILKDHNCLMVDEINDVRIIGLITACFILAVAIAGLSWEARAQLVLLFILSVAIADFMIGTFVPTSKEDKEKGFIGYKLEILSDNFGPDFRNGHSFFSVFGIFFPAATGILAGANISGDLRDAQSAIPKGTLLAILITTIIYLALSWMAGSCVLRDAPGPAPTISLSTGEMVNLTTETSFTAYLSNLTTTAATASSFSTYNATTTLFMTAANMTSESMSRYYTGSLNVTQTINNNSDSSYFCEPGDCKYGIQNDMQVMQLVSLFGPITIAGIISATLSSALASLVSAPRVFQAVCKDRIFPYIHIFAKGYGESEDPRRAYMLAFGIGAACICIGELNAIAPLISNFFLMSYALINYSCVDASLAKSPGWRPAFRYYSIWLSLTGALLCVAVMFIINWWTALLTIGLVAILYFYVHYRKPDINWGSSTQAHVYRNALQHTQKLMLVLEHVKNFRPQVLAMTAFPSERPALVDFCTSITKNISLMVCGHVFVGDPKEKIKDSMLLSKMAYMWLANRKAKSFYTTVTASSLRTGAQALMQSVGIGKLKPNTLIIGFKTDWQTASPQDVEDYCYIIHDAFDLRHSVGVLRLKEGLHMSNLLANNSEGLSRFVQSVQTMFTKEPALPSDCHLPLSPSDATTLTDLAMTPLSENSVQLAMPYELNDNQNDEKDINKNDNSETERDDYEVVDDEDELPKDQQQQPDRNLISKVTDARDVNRFCYKQKGYIDVWWLFDDGGLTLLVPYLMTTKKLWSNCKLRVFMAGTKKNALDRDQRHLATLLHKFRIQYSSMTVITDIGKRPKPESMKLFEEMIQDWKLKPEDGETEASCPWKITEQELSTLKSKTYRHVRLRELLFEHSIDATLIVMTLPMPKKGLCSSGLYLSWLDVMSRDMPPMLLLRGNQENVLTYYS